jgi:aerobic carbon-monoxide dehydrogenase medium subunit
VKPPPFHYAAPTSVAEAVELLAAHADVETRVLAGGQSLVPLMNFRLAQPDHLIDLRRVEELTHIRTDGDTLVIGAMVRQTDAEHSPDVAFGAPLLAEALGYVAHPPIRNSGTVGGSLAHADPCAELPLVAQVLGARMLLRSDSGTRTLDAEKFFAGPMTTNARPGECLEEIHWPAWSWRRTGSAFTEISVRHGDFAMVAAAAQIAIDGDGRCVRAAFGLGGVGGTPLAFPKIAARLFGTRLDEAVVKEAANAAAAESEPGSDLHASTEYRRHLAGVLGARALQEARERARSVR